MFKRRRLQAWPPWKRLIRDELAAAYAKRDFIFSNYVEADGPIEGSPCWEWQRNCNPAGYGVLRYDGVDYLAPRLSWIIRNNGPIPKGLWVLHDCDRPPCLNPLHLHLGTPKQNVAEMWERERTSQYGETHSRTSLDNVKTIEIRKLVEEGYTQALVGEWFGLSQAQVGRIVRGDNWAHLEEGPRHRPRVPASRHEGVSWHTESRRWKARIIVNGQGFHLGTFRSETDAALAYNNAVIERGLDRPLNELEQTEFIEGRCILPSTSAFRGVNWHVGAGKWVARVVVLGERLHLGSFASEIEAAQAYNNAVLEHKLDRPLNVIEEAQPQTEKELEKCLS